MACEAELMAVQMAASYVGTVAVTQQSILAQQAIVNGLAEALAAQLTAMNAVYESALAMQAQAQAALDACRGGGGGAAQGRKPARLETDSDRIAMLEQTVARLADKLRLQGEGKPAA